MKKRQNLESVMVDKISGMEENKSLCSLSKIEAKKFVSKVTCSGKQVSTRLSQSRLDFLQQVPNITVTGVK